MSEEVRGWQVDSKQVRELATKVGVPEGVPLPEVIIVGEEEDESLQGGSQIQPDTSGRSPSGYFITIPESMLEKVDESSYVLGKRTEQNVRHELAHYVGYSEPGTSVGQDADPYRQVVKEIRADLRGGVRNLSLTLSKQAINLRDDYGLPMEEAFRLTSRAALSLGVSKSTVSRSRRLYFDEGSILYRGGKWKE